MKLYCVNLTCNHCEEAFGIVVANSEEEAIAIVKKEQGIDFTYFESADVLDEICGYKVTFKKGKKIVFDKS